MKKFWNARWIRSKKDYGAVSPIFKREFCLDKSIEKAVLHITAMGVYEAFLNDKRVGNFVMAPGWTIYNERHQYQSYDVTKLMKEKNELVVTVGKGWYRGELVDWRAKDIWGGFSAIIAVLDIEYSDGTNETVVSDKEWKVSESSILFSEIYDGETFDAGFVPAEWDEVVYLHASKDNLVPQECEFVTEHEELLPEKMFVTPKGETIIDFGQNITGYVFFEIGAMAGERLVYSHAEVLDKDGNFYTGNLRSAKQKIEYICKDGLQSYKPHHTFMGFRYIRLEEFPKNVRKENFKAIVVHTDMKRTGHFACSNEKVNKLYQNIIWGQKGNFLDIPTDCPQRDERLGWTGDAQMFVKTAAYNYDVRLFFKKWLRDLAAAQREDVGIIPPGAAWGDAAVICPWQIYLTYGDTEVLSEQLESMKAWIEYMHTHGPEEFLWRGDVQFGDWLGMDAGEGDYKGASDPDFIASAYFAYSTSLVIKVLKVLGQDTEYYVNLYENIVKAFKERYNKCNTQTECAVALVFGLTDDVMRVPKKLADLVQNNGNKLTPGFVGTPYILQALSENGHEDIAYSLLLQEEYPSWLFSVNMGATTIWEHWDGMKADGSMWSDDMNSFNHYAYGAVASWLYETVAGIRIDEHSPGFENVILSPKPDRRLEWAEASIETKYGTVTSKWRYSGDTVEYEFTVPNKAILRLDGKDIYLENGKHSF